MEIGNWLMVSRQAINDRPDIVVLTCLRDCVLACQRYGIEPVGSFEMRTLTSSLYPDELDRIVYHFIEGAR